MAKIDPVTGKIVKTGGRQKGTKNASTVRIEEALEKAAKMINEPRTNEWFDGDAKTLLKIIYQSPHFPVRTRMEAAQISLRVETPTLQAIDQSVTESRNYVVRLPAPVEGATQKEKLAAWWAEYGTPKTTDEKADAEW